jgi:transcriptional regulator of acetoin/glycerol metabolism
MTEEPEIGPDDLELPGRTARSNEPAPPPPAPSNLIPSSPPSDDARARSADEFKENERARILQALDACSWNRLNAAKMVGLPRRTFYRRLKEFGIL